MSGTIQKYINLSVKTTAFEIEATKMRIVDITPEVSGASTTPDYSHTTGDSACGIENYNEAYLCGIDVTTNSVLVGETMRKIEVPMWVTTTSKSGTIWAGVVNTSWDRGDLGASQVANNLR